MSDFALCPSCPWPSFCSGSSARAQQVPGVLGPLAVVSLATIEGFPPPFACCQAFGEIQQSPLRTPSILMLGGPRIDFYIFLFFLT